MNKCELRQILLDTECMYNKLFKYWNKCEWDQIVPDELTKLHDAVKEVLNDERISDTTENKTI